MEYIGLSTQRRCIGIASDHGGFELKKKLSQALKDEGYDLVDFGARHYNKYDDSMNVMCLGDNVTGYSLALELVRIFLNASFKETERYVRRLNKVSLLELEKPD